MKTGILNLLILIYLFLVNSSCENRSPGNTDDEVSSVIMDNSSQKDILAEEQPISLAYIDSHKEDWIFLKYWDQMTEDEFDQVTDVLAKTDKIEVIAGYRIFEAYVNNDSIRFQISPKFNDSGYLDFITIFVNSRSLDGSSTPLRKNTFKAFTKLYEEKYGKSKLSTIDLRPTMVIDTYTFQKEDSRIEITESYQNFEGIERLGLAAYSVKYYGQIYIEQENQKKLHLNDKEGQTQSDI